MRVRVCEGAAVAWLASTQAGRRRDRQHDRSGWQPAQREDASLAMQRRWIVQAVTGDRVAPGQKLAPIVGWGWCDEDGSRSWRPNAIATRPCCVYCVRAKCPRVTKCCCVNNCQLHAWHTYLPWFRWRVLARLSSLLLNRPLFRTGLDWAAWVNKRRVRQATAVGFSCVSLFREPWQDPASSARPGLAILQHVVLVAV
ncbi:hypothetical protein F4802DRAFT_446465 [Xylaria palmicola]|nr:hypothetical protein F4802DRAFT_446465 [Xylaria palmicola]